MCICLFASSKVQPFCFSLWFYNSATLGKIKTFQLTKQVISRDLASNLNYWCCQHLLNNPHIYFIYFCVLIYKQQIRKVGVVQSSIKTCMKTLAGLSILYLDASQIHTWFYIYTIFHFYHKLRLFFESKSELFEWQINKGGTLLQIRNSAWVRGYWVAAPGTIIRSEWQLGRKCIRNQIMQLE